MYNLWGCFTCKLEMLALVDKLDKDADLNEDEERFLKRMRKLAVSMPGYYTKEVFIEAKEEFPEAPRGTALHTRGNVTKPEKKMAEEIGEQQPSAEQFPAPACFPGLQGTPGTSLASTPACLPGDPRDQPHRDTCQQLRGPKGPAWPKQLPSSHETPGTSLARIRAHLSGSPSSLLRNQIPPPSRHCTRWSPATSSW